MSDLFSAYCKLISSPAQLARCQEATSVSELLSVIKYFWQQSELSDDQLLAELTQLNQRVISSDNIHLAGHWLPYRYHAKSRIIDWCLAAGHATEPFQDQTIARYRQTILVNQLITPKTSLALLDIQAKFVRPITPAGFIFHLSRCGSTLVSGCLSELESTCVFSEPPLLTELLLDKTLSTAVQQGALRRFINLMAAAYPHRPKLIIKWNAWDIFHWDLICGLYPQVPVLFLVRNPVEILASHQRLAGRHMSGDVTLAHHHTVFSNWSGATTVLEKRMEVLLGLLCAMHKALSERFYCVIDYQQLNLPILVKIMHCFRLDLSEKYFLKIKARMQLNSKYPAQLFFSDKEEKMNRLTPQEAEQIKSYLIGSYNKLLELSEKWMGSVKHVK